VKWLVYYSTNKIETKKGYGSNFRNIGKEKTREKYKLDFNYMTYEANIVA